MLTGCSGLQGTGDKGYITGTGTVSQFPADERGEPIDLRGEDLDGAALDLEELRGTPVVVVVWGSWCTPCRAEAPDVIAAAEQLGTDAEFVGINIRNSSVAESQAFVRSFGVPYPSFFSPGGEALLPFAGTLTLYTIPGFVVLDDEGRVAASIIGRLPSTTTLVDLVEDVDAAGVSPKSVACCASSSPHAGGVVVDSTMLAHRLRSSALPSHALDDARDGQDLADTPEAEAGRRG